MRCNEAPDNLVKPESRDPTNVLMDGEAGIAAVKQHGVTLLHPCQCECVFPVHVVVEHKCHIGQRRCKSDCLLSSREASANLAQRYVMTAFLQPLAYSQC